ncbi:DUF1579 domain-containing protein [Flavobacterium reichenbachii]|uniref:DUF1579 domain-containing protein n=1 Tax=Flavobacterium reichenbachii TaxID=362418 RepID=A0A085ZSQ4_9FLAO|nr:DUF1579 domain-containing protein [Flavobacterium reichenbachii]KFF07468.1 hypothetical protein IW19_19015 [Flavobacterium reichenbachii]OXB14109.1 hypothetical protein B0A68_12850 [Flavobacterium reichenbachii]
MKNFMITLSVLVFCFSSCKKEIKAETENTITADGVKVEEPIAEKPIDSAAEMKAWAEYAAPGNPHKMMADETGTWNCEMTFWMTPNGKPEKAASTAEIKMILGGRYQEANYKGTMMGQPFEGKSTLAYNNASREYTTTFIDNMGTGMMVAMGKYDEKTKSMELKGEVVNPVNGKKTPYREIYTIVDGKTRKMEMFDVKNGEEYKSMEIVMSKK